MSGLKGVPNRLAVVALTLSLLIAAACAEDEPAEPRVGGEEGRPLPEAAAGTEAGQLLTEVEPEERYSIGIALPNLPDPAWRAMARGAEDYAEVLGIDIRVVDAGGYENVERQVSQIEDLVQAGVDGIVLAPVDPEALAPAVGSADDRGVPVVTFITAETSGRAVAEVNQDTVLVGTLQCEALAEEHPDARVIMLSGPVPAETAVSRRDGFEECANEKGMTILAERLGPSDRADAVRHMEDALVSFGDELDAVFTFSSFMALGVADVLEREGLQDDIIIVTASPSEEAIDRLIAGDIGAVVAEFVVVMQNTALAALVAHLNGEEVSSFIETPLQIVTSEEAPNHDWYWEVPDY